MQFCCPISGLILEKIRILTSTLFFYHPLGWRGGEIFKKLFHSVVSAHKPHIYAKFGDFSSYDFRKKLSVHDRRKDGLTDRQREPTGVCFVYGCLISRVSGIIIRLSKYWSGKESFIYENRNENFLGSMDNQ